MRSYARREYGSDFMRVLQHRFPQARVLWMDASQLGSYDLFPGANVGAVVSGLPLLSIVARKIMSIASGALQSHAAHRKTLPVHLWSALPGAAAHSRFGSGSRPCAFSGTVRNIPPASVYRITRQPPPAPELPAALQLSMRRQHDLTESHGGRDGNWRHAGIRCRLVHRRASAAQLSKLRTTVRGLSKEPAVRAAVASCAGSTDRLTFFAADLTADDGWDDAMAGCADVLRHLSARRRYIREPDALIVPARDGTVRVLPGCSEGGASGPPR